MRRTNKGLIKVLPLKTPICFYLCCQWGLLGLIHTGIRGCLLGVCSFLKRYLEKSAAVEMRNGEISGTKEAGLGEIWGLWGEFSGSAQILTLPSRFSSLFSESVERQLSHRQVRFMLALTGSLISLAPWVAVYFSSISNKAIVSDPT